MLENLTLMTTSSAHDALARWNELDAEEAAREILPCCGSGAWARGMAASRPFAALEDLFRRSDAVWAALTEAGWCEAFDSHPRIGQHHARAATAESLAWSSEEQRAAMSPDVAARAALAEGNRRYEEKFGRIFIVCASGRTATEIGEILQRRMENSAEAEVAEAAEQQHQITQLRLRRWMGVT